MTAPAPAPAPAPRPLDKEHHSPSWLNRQNTQITVVITGMFVLVGMTLNFAMNAIDLARESQTANEAFHRTLVTTKHADIDKVLHLEMHQDWEHRFTTLLQAKGDLIKANFKHQVEMLPRPPKEVAAELKSLGVRVQGVEHMIDRLLEDTMDRGRCPGNP